jgi:hypothetical protein
MRVGLCCAATFLLLISCSPGAKRVVSSQSAANGGETVTSGEPAVSTDSRSTHGVLVSLNSEDGALGVLDTEPPRLLGTMTAGYRPWVLVRRMARQLLVSQAFGPGPGIEGPTLRIFSLDDLSAPVVVVPMPNRDVETVYSPAMTLSNDERYLYYGKRETAAGCSGGGERCDLPSVGVIDLVVGREVARAQLPQGCGYPRLHGINGSDALVMCPGAGVMLMLVKTDGSVSAVGVLPLAEVREVDMGFGVGEGFYVVYRDGTVRATGRGDIAHFLPADASIVFNSGADVGGGMRLLAYGNASNDAIITGVIVYSAGDPLQYRRIVVPLSSTTAVAPIGDHLVALLGADAAIRLFDLDTGQIDPNSIPAPSGAEYLVAG